MIVPMPREPLMHTHYSAANAVSAMLSILLLGTAIRLISAHLIASQRTGVAGTELGKALAFQY